MKSIMIVAYVIPYGLPFIQSGKSYECTVSKVDINNMPVSGHVYGEDGLNHHINFIINGQMPDGTWVVVIE